MLNKKIKKQRGITLIALVITIIVLLILAGVTIATLIGDNGILTKAGQSREQTSIGDEKEKVKLSAEGALIKDNGKKIKRNYLNEELTSYIGIEGTDYILSETATFIVEYLDSGRKYIIDENGEINKYEDISEYLKIGEYVDYNPMVQDKDGTLVNEEKLTYTSPIGTATEHGNGAGEQKFTATNDIKWKILNINNGMVELISEEVIKTDANQNFIFEGARGYLYAEQELNEICKIYGYGYGANLSKGGSYTVGGPLDNVVNGKVEGTGARSITFKDVEKLVGITEEDYPSLNENYGNTAYPTENVYYPTIDSSKGNPLTGVSDVAEVKNIKNTFYRINKSSIENKDVLDILANGNYWLASRNIQTKADNVWFNVCMSWEGEFNSGDIAHGYTSGLQENHGTDWGIRPIVTLKYGVIDFETDYEKEGHWNLK